MRSRSATGSRSNLGARFDHSRAIHQDLHAVDAEGRETDEIIPRRGHAGATWNIVSPRLGVTMKLTADGRTMVRASVLPVQPGCAHRRAAILSSGGDQTGHDDALPGGDRRLHGHAHVLSIPR